MAGVIAALSFILKIFPLYFACIAICALFRRKSCPRRPPATRFAVLAAARNEEAVIAGLVESLQGQNYPPELVDIYVIPNNCTDHTEAVAAAAGAEIIHCPGSVRCKGDALQEAIRQLLPEQYDAFVVFDADNRVHPDFLARTNDAIQAGARVCKGKIRSGNPADSWIAGCYGLYSAAFDWFFSRPRGNCGLSAKLVGTGFAVHRQVLEALGGWNTATIAEDAEFAAQCAGVGWRVHWVPEAVTYDEAPTDLKTSLIQRRRWCSGVMQVARRRLPGLLRGTGPLRLRLDMAMFLLAPFAQALSLLLLPACLLAGGTAFLPGCLALLSATYAVTALLGLALSLGEGYGLRGMLPAILGYPLFMAAWPFLQVTALFRDVRSWREIPHRGSNPSGSPLQKRSPSPIR